MLFLLNLPIAFEIGFRIWWSRLLIPVLNLGFANFYLRCAFCWGIVWFLQCRWCPHVSRAVRRRVYLPHPCRSSAIVGARFSQTWRLLYVTPPRRGWRLAVVMGWRVCSSEMFATRTWNTRSTHKSSVKFDGTAGGVKTTD